MQITIESNVGLVRQGLQDLSAEIPKIGRRKIYDAMNRITREMEGYPGERANQTYVRTGNLGASWKVERTEDGYIVSNDARSASTVQRRTANGIRSYRNKSAGRRYTRYVVGDAYGLGQAWMHKGRWPLFRDVVDKELDKMPDEVAEQIELVARRVLPQGTGV
jgi:hypothetical protein